MRSPEVGISRRARRLALLLLLFLAAASARGGSRAAGPAALAQSGSPLVSARAIGGPAAPADRGLRATGSSPQRGSSTDSESFWSWDFYQQEYFRLQATRLHVSPSLWLYVEEGQSLPGRSLVRFVSRFEDEILPELRQAYGSEPSPGIDGERAITVLLMDLRDAQYHKRDAGRYVSGYFDPANQLRAEDLVRGEDPRRSNEREMIYLDVGPSVGLDEQDLLRSAAHELTHLILWQHDPDKPSWLAEALAELAGFLVGLGHPREHVNLYLRNTEIPLTAWSGEPEEIGKGYLFGLYLYDRFAAGQSSWFRPLVQATGPGTTGLAQVLAGEGELPERVFRDYLLALHLSGASIDDPRYRFRSIQLGSSQPPDGFRVPALRRHGPDPELSQAFELPPWAARVDELLVRSQPTRWSVALPPGVCGSLVRFSEPEPPAGEPQVVDRCPGQDGTEEGLLVPEPDPASVTRLLGVFVNPGPQAIQGRLEAWPEARSSSDAQAFLPLVTLR